MEYKCEAVAMLESPGVSVSQIAEELGIGTNVPESATPGPVGFGRRDGSEYATSDQDRSPTK